MIVTRGFVVNRAGRVVVPANFFPSLDVRAFDTLEQLQAVIRRDFEAKAPSEAAILARIEAGEYGGRYDLLRDVGANLGWANRYALTLYERRPTRWRDVPRRRDGVFLATPAYEPRLKATAAIERAYHSLAPSWDEAAEHIIFTILLDIFRNTWGTGVDVEAVNPTAAEALAEDRLLHRIAVYDPDTPIYSRDDIVHYTHPATSLESLMRQAMVLGGAGLVLGVPAAYATTRVLRRVLFQVDPDAVLLASLAAVIGGVALLAGWAPAWRAASIDPAQALR